MSNSKRARRPNLREQAKQRTRQALIDAALVCFTEAGLDAPSLDGICERAGCTRGAFYVHFADRDELIAAAMEQRRGAVLAKLLELPTGAVTIPQLLELFSSAVAQRVFPIPGAVRAGELLAACRRSKKIQKMQQRLMNETCARLLEQVRSDQAHKLLRADLEPASLATLLLVLEAGTELLLDLGVDADIGAAAATFSRLIAHSPRPRTLRRQDE
jgi:AcrR family transcriptional regulator